MEKKFKVAIVSKAIHRDYYEVTASSKEEALKKANRGEVGNFIDSYTEATEDCVDIEIIGDDDN